MIMTKNGTQSWDTYFCPVADNDILEIHRLPRIFSGHVKVHGVIPMPEELAPVRYAHFGYMTSYHTFRSAWMGKPTTFSGIIHVWLLKVTDLGQIFNSVGVFCGG